MFLKLALPNVFACALVYVMSEIGYDVVVDTKRGCLDVSISKACSLLIVR